MVAPEEEAEAEAVDLSKTVLRCNARFIESGEPPAAGREAATGFAVRLPNVAAPCLMVRLVMEGDEEVRSMPGLAGLAATVARFDEPLLSLALSADLARPGVTSLPARSTARKRFGITTPLPPPPVRDGLGNVDGGGGGSGAPESAADGDRIVRCPVAPPKSR